MSMLEKIMFSAFMAMALFMAYDSHGATLPPNAVTYLPALKEAVGESWADNQYPWFLAGQVEQETCISLKSRGCWNPRTELKTSREYGFGLGQITITSKFNNFEETRKMSSELKSWKWEDRYNPHYQLLGLIAFNKVNYNRVKNSSSELDKQAFSFSAYNGGFGGVLKDRKLCSSTPGCNPGIWFGNVEKTSFKQKTKVSGYGQSFFEINRGYVQNIIYVRSDKYKYGF